MFKLQQMLRFDEHSLQNFIHKNDKIYFHWAEISKKVSPLD